MKLYKKNTTKKNLNKKGSSVDLFNVFQRKHTNNKKKCLWNCSVSSVDTVRFKGNHFFDSEKSKNNQILQFFCTFENNVNTIWI